MIDVGVLQIQHPDGQVFAFEPGSLCVAFAMTGSPTHPEWFETLEVTADLGRWANAVLGASRVTVSRLTSRTPGVFGSRSGGLPTRSSTLAG